MKLELEFFFFINIVGSSPTWFV